MGNQNLENKSRCVYRTEGIINGDYISDIEDRENFKGKYDSMLFQIEDAFFDD